LRSRSSGRRRRSAVPLAFACNRTWVRTIGGPSDDHLDLQGSLHPSGKVPANRGFTRRSPDSRCGNWHLLADVDIPRPDGHWVQRTSRPPPCCGSAANPQKRKQDVLPGLRCGKPPRPSFVSRAGS
jgi:hypothetical protein